MIRGRFEGRTAYKLLYKLKKIGVPPREVGLLYEPVFNLGIKPNSEGHDFNCVILIAAPGFVQTTLEFCNIGLQRLGTLGQLMQSVLRFLNLIWVVVHPLQLT